MQSGGATFARRRAFAASRLAPVVSSNLKSVGYDANSSTLEIEFHSGGIYRYADVPASEYRALMSADSKGRYFNAHIKGGGYSYRRLR